MDGIQKYAPILHTGFGSGYTNQQMKDFVSWVVERGYSGFSTEGKSEPRTDNIDKWIDGFMQGLGCALSEARAKDIEAWLFDEWGYPTGTAGGKVIGNHTEWRSKKLHLAVDIPLETGQSVDILLPGHFICAAAWHVGRNIFGAPLSEDIPVCPDNGRLKYTAKHKRERLCVVTWEYDCFRTVGVFEPDPEDDTQGTLDLLCHDAVSCFISEMHERYFKNFQEYFGNTIKGFFYDEPFVSYPAPYTFDIFEEFERSKGYDIIPRLPRIMAGLDVKGLLDYRDVCTTRVAEAFYGQMSRWCKEHGVAMVGHQDLDHSIRTLDSVSGHFFKNSAYNDAPGVDYIWAQIQPGVFTDFPRLAGSAARIAGKPYAVSESFAATSSCLYPDYMRFCMEYQIVRGISKFFLMIADPLGDKGMPVSRDHPQNAAFAPILNRRIAQTCMLANTSKPSAEVAVYIPMDDVFRGLLNQRNPSAVSFAPYAPLWDYIDKIAELLCHMPIDFDYIWKEAILNLPIENGAFITKLGQSINTVIVPPCVDIDSDVGERLNELLNSGGKVIFINNAPRSMIGKSSVCPEASGIASFINPNIILSLPGQISVAERISSNGNKLFFFLNESEHTVETEIKFPLEGNILKYNFDKELWTDARHNKVIASFEPMSLLIYAVADSPTGNIELTKGDTVCNLSSWTAVTPEGELALPSLDDWRNFYKEDYTGWISYLSDLDIQCDGNYRIDLGRVCYAAKIYIDDVEFTAAFAPYLVDAYLTAGIHKIKVDVLNTSVNKYLGNANAELASQNEAWFKTRFGSDRKFLESGLFGPVKVYALKM